MRPYRRPGRWELYALYGLMAGLLGAQAALPVSVRWHQVMEAGVVGATLGLMALWRHRNTAALEDDRILHDIAKRAATGRHVPLTQVQARYLVAQARRNQNPDAGSSSTPPSPCPHRS